MKNSISTIQLSLPKGGGAIQGVGETFKAEEFTGVASLSVPIPTSPCRGFEPRLALDYSSASGNGIFGFGFEIAIPSVSRKTAKGTPRYDESDTFILSQAEDLVPIDGRREDQIGTTHYVVKSYRPRVEGLFAQIEHWVEKARPGLSHWRVVGKDNVVSVFGKPAIALADAPIIADPMDQGHIVKWLLSETFDALGNHAVYEYRSEDDANLPRQSLCEQNRSQTANRYLKRIKYGNAQPFREGHLESQEWHFEVVFDYGEHEIPPDGSDPYESQSRPWKKRQDSFSTYHAGFEVRTHRLCHGVLMFHRFTEIEGSQGNPILVHATRFRYEESPGVTLLKAVEAIGYRFQGAYQEKRTPPIEFDHAPFQPTDRRFERLLEAGHRHLTGVDGEPDYRLIDLYGEGIPGILYSDGNTVLYWEPEGPHGPSDAPTAVHYTAPTVPDTLPIESRRLKINPLLMDLTGNGRLDLVVTSTIGSGYYQIRPDRGWTPFQPFASFPNDFHNPDNHLVDVTGNGLADIVLIDDKGVSIYPSLGEGGFGPALVQDRQGNLPASTRGSANEMWLFADILGSGTQHLVHIANGKVECWPNLGYGRFGKPVQLENAPRFGAELDASRLLLADLDGSGTLDLVYLHPDRVDIWFNRSGNAFAATPTSITLPGHWDRLNQIGFADVHGNGTSCLVFTENHPEPRHWCYDFCGQQKPYLLTGIDNHLGARTTLTYRSSTQYYLDDKRLGVPWLGNLPFPVQVVEKVRVEDQISGTTQVSTYGYHHGCYDGMEREYRGFGLVERWDAETLSLDAQPTDQPPVLTKTWYHTGIGQTDGSLSRSFAGQYFDGDAEAIALPDSLFDRQGAESDPETLRQAFCALKGAVLRQEVYAPSAPVSLPWQKQDAPYTVSEHNYRVKLLQPLGKNENAVFFVHPQETITYDYERNPADPRIHHDVVLKVDEFGNVLRSCNVAYGRRAKEALPEQLDLKITVVEDGFINKTEAGIRLLGIPMESKAYGVVNPPTPLQGYFSLASLDQFLQESLGTSATCLLAWHRYRYWNPERGKPGELADVGAQALLAQVEAAEFSVEQIAEAYAGTTAEAELDRGGYRLDQGYWWNPGLTESYLGADKFFLPKATTDAFGNPTATINAYDPHGFFPLMVTDAMGNCTRVVKIDYQALQVQQIADINGNLSEVLFDPLGAVVVLSEYKPLEDGRTSGFRPLSAYRPAGAASVAELADHPETYVQGAKSYFHYDLFSWKDRRVPVHAVSLIPETVPDASGDIQIHIAYSDGLGREVQRAAKVEPGEACRIQPDGTAVEPSTAEVERWLASGRTVYNNKGLPVKQYEPYYIDTWRYIDNLTLNCFGVSPTLHYDPLGRQTRTDTPKGFFSKVEFTPWLERHFDENDTVKDSDFYKKHINNSTEAFQWERQALEKAAECHDTPDEKILDNLGRVIRDIQIAGKGVPPLVTHYRWDIGGNQIASADPRLSLSGKTNFETLYSLGGAALKTVSADAGTRWVLHNVMGNPIYARDARGFETRTRYDALHRPVEVRIANEADGALSFNHVVERIVYGDSLDEHGQAVVAEPEKRNLRGKPYRHYDQAGLVRIERYNCMGLPLKASRQLLANYRQEPDWSNLSKAALEPEVYETAYSYDALGRVIRETDPDGNVTVPSYHLSGHINQIRVGGECHVAGIAYNAKGQRLSIAYGNGVVTRYDYEAETFRLRRIASARESGADGKKLQDLSYVYDPAGNITHITDRAQEAVFNGNAEIPPEADYRYDALYRLTQATGREHPGLANAPQRCGDFEGLPMPQIGDGQALQNYRQAFSYDAAGNLFRVQHEGARPWTLDLTVSSASNRAAESAIAPAPDQVDALFDANGNQKRLNGLPGIAWNYRDNIAHATVIDRSEQGKPSDAEYYVYDGGGQRIRKVTERYGGSGTANIEETIYLGGLEIRRSRRNGEIVEERRSLRVMDGDRAVATRLKWIKGAPPAGVDNPQLRYQLDNHLGSATLELDAQGRIISYEEYYPYGGTSMVMGRNAAEVKLKQYRYSGKERDSVTGLYYYGFRYYAPWLGRWMSPDPAGTVDGLNLYGFVNCNPISHVDRKGNCGDQVTAGNDTSLLRKKSKQIKKVEKAKVEIDKRNARRKNNKKFASVGIGENGMIESIEFNANRLPFPKKVKDLVRERTKNPENLKPGNDLRHIFPNQLTKHEIQHEYTGIPAADALNDLIQRKVLPENANIKDLSEGIDNRYKAEALNPDNLWFGSGEDNQYAGRTMGATVNNLIDGSPSKSVKEISDRLGETIQISPIDQLIQLAIDPPQDAPSGDFFKIIVASSERINNMFLPYT